MYKFRVLFDSSTYVVFLSENKNFNYAQNKDEIVGYVQYAITDDTLYIEHLNVYKDYQHQGLGKTLMLSALKHAYSKNIETAELDAMGVKDEKNNLFYDMGFRYVSKDFPEMKGNIKSILKL